MKPLHQLLAASLLCSLIACQENNKAALQSRKDIASIKEKNIPGDDNAAIGTMDTMATPGHEQLKQSLAPRKSQSKEDWDKKIIKTGHLTVSVKNYQAFDELVHNGIKQFGGYIAQEEQTQSGDKIENTVIIKVPADQFDNAIIQLTPGTEKLIEKKITSDDVTAEMVDIKSRAEAKKRVRDRYLDLLKQAKNMEEILQVQNEVNGIQENIEAAAGRMDYLSHAAAFSTININFYQLINAPGINNPESTYGYRVLESFRSGLHWFTELFVLLVMLWPLWMGVLVAWFFIKKQKLPVAKTSKQVSGH